MRNIMIIKKLKIYEIVLTAIWLSVMFCLLLLNIRDFRHHAKSYSYDVASFDSDDNGYRTPQTYLRKGIYLINLEYSCPNPVNYIITYGNDMITGQIIAGENVTDQIPIVIDDDYFNIYLRLHPAENETIQIDSVTIHSQKRLNNDIFLFLLNILFMSLAGVYFIFKWRTLSAEEKLTVVILISTFIVMSIPNSIRTLFYSGDIRVHLIRTEGIKDGLLEGQFPVLVYPNSFNGFGEVGSLYPKTFLYIPAILRVLGVSMPTSYRLLVFLINVFTVLFSYISFKLISQNRIAAALGTCFYSLFPYRMYIMSSSGSAIGRGISIAFLPLVMAGTYQILFSDNKIDGKALNIDSRRGILFLTIGMSGILMSHVLHSVMTVMLVLMLVVFNPKRFIKSFKSFIIAVMLTVCICASTIHQLFYFYFQDLNLSYLKFNLYDKLFNINSFIRSPYNWIVAIGIIAYICGLIIYKQKNNTVDSELLRLDVIFIVFAILFCILAIDIVPYYKILENPIAESILSTFQNMKRLYFITNILIAYLVCIAYKRLSSTIDKMNIKSIVVGITCIIVIVCGSVEFPGFFGCGLLADEVVASTEHQQIEYIPNGNDIESFHSSAAIISEENALSVSSYTKNKDSVYIKYTCSNDSTYTDLPMFMFGNLRYAYDENGNSIPLYTGLNSRVRVYFEKTDVEKEIHVAFKEPIMFRVSVLISLVASLLILLYIVGACPCGKSNVNLERML